MINHILLFWYLLCAITIKINLTRSYLILIIANKAHIGIDSYRANSCGKTHNFNLNF